MIRAAILLLAAAFAAPAWTESVEFPWERLPRQLWERELVWLHNIGATRVSLRQTSDLAGLTEAVQLVRRLNLQADLEGPVPASLEPQLLIHSGPLVPVEPSPVERVSVLRPDAISYTRTLLGAGAGSILWTDVEDTLDATGYHPGAVSLNGTERPGTVALRRALRLSRYWGARFPLLREAPGAGLQTPVEGVTVRQFGEDFGASMVSVVNRSAKPFNGDLRVSYPAMKRTLVIPGVKVAAGDALWLPVSIPLQSGPLCKDCLAFATVDHLIYATAELTAIEYENGILAMEFYAPTAGEVVLQMSRQPSGPLVAAGHPVAFDWDEHTQRVRLPIPAGTGQSKQVRVGLAIEAPDSAAFFDSAKVLLIGEQNLLTARFSSSEIAGRSRLRTAPELAFRQQTPPGLPALEYRLDIPVSAAHGDRAEISIEADGRRISHANPTILRPVTVRFPEAIEIPLAADSSLPLYPATIPVNRRQGREVTISIQNNAAAIRTFRVEPHAAGLEFSPAVREFAVGASATRDVTFRVFVADTPQSLRDGEVRISGDAVTAEPMQFVVLGPESTPLSSGPFSILESSHYRAVFLAGRWLQFLDKESGKGAIPAGGIAWDQSRGSPAALRLEDLAALASPARAR